MRLYLDDDSAEVLLRRLLQRGGHDVVRPSDLNMAGESDPVHLTHAIALNRTLLSANYDDFEELHYLVRQAGGTHPGILMIRRDNDRRRDLTVHGITAAISNLVAAGVPVENEFIILNHWR